MKKISLTFQESHEFWRDGGHGDAGQHAKYRHCRSDRRAANTRSWRRLHADEESDWWILNNQESQKKFKRQFCPEGICSRATVISDHVKRIDDIS